MYYNEFIKVEKEKNNMNQEVFFKRYNKKQHIISSYVYTNDNKDLIATSFVLSESESKRFEKENKDILQLIDELKDYEIYMLKNTNEDKKLLMLDCKYIKADKYNAQYYEAKSWRWI